MVVEQLRAYARASDGRAADRRAADGRAAGGRASRPGVVVPFRSPAVAANGFSIRDRMTLLAWADAARADGVCRVTIERADAADGAQDLGEFAMIYAGSAEWASWAVAREAGSFMVWSPNTDRSFGHFPTLGAALAMIGAMLG